MRSSPRIRSSELLSCEISRGSIVLALFELSLSWCGLAQPHARGFRHSLQFFFESFSFDLECEAVNTTLSFTQNQAVGRLMSDPVRMVISSEIHARPARHNPPSP